MSEKTLNLEAINRYFITQIPAANIANKLDFILFAIAYIGGSGEHTADEIRVSIPDMFDQNMVHNVKCLRDVLRQVSVDNGENLEIEETIDYGC